MVLSGTGNLRYVSALVVYPDFGTPQSCTRNFVLYGMGSLQYVPALIVMYPEFGPVWHGQC